MTFFSIPTISMAWSAKITKGRSKLDELTRILSSPISSRTRVIFSPAGSMRSTRIVKNWGRPDDTIGVAGIINGLAPNHQTYFAAGGLGILIGDGALPNYGLEQIVEAYYSYAFTDSTKVTFDYQFIANPAYNVDRGPVNVFAGRFHTAF